MRSITLDIFCHKCRRLWQATSLYSIEPSGLIIQAEETTQSLNCSTCGQVGGLELIAISDPLQNELDPPILVKTVLNQVRFWHLKAGMQVSSTHFKHVSVTGGYIEAELNVFKGTQLVMTFTIKANGNKITEIMVSGVPTAILNSEDLFDHDNFFGIPLLGYSVNEDDPDFWFLISIADSY